MFEVANAVLFSIERSRHSRDFKLFEVANAVLF